MTEARFARLHDGVRRLFALPRATLALIDKRQSPQFRGWEPVGSERTNGRVDVREQVDLWTEHPARAPDASPPWLRLHGANQWLPDAVVPGLRADVEAWLADMGRIADTLLDLFSRGLGLTPRHLRGLFGPEPMSLLKLIHYPPTPAGGAGVNAHHDTGFVTLLADFGQPGLEIETAQGWVPAPAVPGGLVVNLGEMLQAMTGNYLRATPHRVVSPAERISVGYFHGPSLETELSPLALADRFVQAVAASARHRDAGYMALERETRAGVGDMGSRHRPAVYGEQLWNYFSRSYPELVWRHHPDQDPG